MLPLYSPGAISPAEACIAAALLAGQHPGNMSSRLPRDSIGDLPQDVISQIANCMNGVRLGGEDIPKAFPQILFGQGNLRTLTSQRHGCHAIVVAFSIERQPLVQPVITEANVTLAL